MGLVRAARFLRRLLRSPDATVGTAHGLDTSRGPVEADVYRPVGAPAGTVVALHGLSPRAHRDPRLVVLCRALAGSGVLVVAPRIDVLARLRLYPLAHPEMTAVLAAVCDDPALGPRVPLGVVAPSFAGGQALAAVAAPAVRDDVGALLLLGAYHDARALAAHLLADEAADPYGRLILVRRYLEAAGELTDGFEDAVQAALEDEALARPDAHLPRVLARLAAPERARFLALRDDRATRVAFGRRFVARHGPAIDEVSVTHAIPHVGARVALLHGERDAVIPAAASRSLHRHLCDAGKRSRLCTTPLLDHGDTVLSARRLLGVPGVLAVFGAWFDGLRAAPARGPPRSDPPAAAVPLARPVGGDTIRAELARLPEGACLVDAPPYRVVAFRAPEAPHLMRAIGRERERSFRASGEGTGRAADLDPWDDDYTQLVLWDAAEARILGGYRLAPVSDTVAARGLSGLYTRSCFVFDEALLGKLSHAIELGRSFVVPEAQRSFRPLLLLWRGIGHWFDRHPRHHRILGIVSMSAAYSQASRSEVARFLLTGAHGSPWRGLVAPVHPFDLDGDSAPPASLRDLERAVVARDGRRPPILVKQYLQIGARGLCAGVDPAFGGCLDVLCVADLRAAEPAMLRRSMGDDVHARFVQRHGSLADVT